MKPQDYLEAARVPHSLEPQRIGHWIVERRGGKTVELVERAELMDVGWPDYTILRRVTMARLHLQDSAQEIVMEDSRQELRRHLPIWLAAHGRVLLTGLGLGCVVRGLLANAAVEHIDVLESDPVIVALIGPEFQREPRVRIHKADAFEWPIPAHAEWDYAWHDIWTEDGSSALNFEHARLLERFRTHCHVQGAWQFPRVFKRIWPERLLGAPA